MEVRRRRRPRRRRSARVASLVAIAYLARAISTGAVLDWALFVVMGVIGVVNLAALLDARTPLLVADDLGVRLRLGRTWVGLPWGGLPGRAPPAARAGGATAAWCSSPTTPERVLDELDPSGRRRRLGSTAAVRRAVRRPARPRHPRRSAPSAT